MLSIYDDLGPIYACKIISNGIFIHFCSDWVWNPNEDNADDDDEILEPKFSGRDGTIYLVDAQNFGLGEENFAVVLKCIEAGMLNGILMNDRDLVRVPFWQPFLLCLVFFYI